eukprot:XP_011670948.1 PREDICTED: uncharacterized protein LOC587349 [Strongylocentrotus purpuratus]
MEKNMPPPSYAAHPPQYGHPSTQYGQPPPVVTAPQPAYHHYPQPNNNMSMNNTVVVPSMGPAYGGGTTIIRTQRGNDSCCSGSVPNFDDTVGKVTGLIMLVGGIITILIIAVSLVMREYYEYSGLGSSIGASIFFYIPTGILGACSYQKSSCVVISFLIMCILTSLEAFAMIVYEGVAAGLLSYDYICEWIFCYWEQNTVVVAMHVIACIIAFVIFISAIVGSVYACMGMNSSVGAAPATMVVTTQPVTFHPTVQSTTTTHTSSTYGGSHTATNTTYY